MSVADEERAAFERYMSSDIGPADLKRSPAGYYESEWTRGAWFGWIARSLEIDALRDALADATERAKAAEGYIAKIEAIRGKKLGVPCCCDFADDDDGETPIVECGYHRAIRKERDALATLCKESLETLRHARVFVTSRQKMHPHGVELWDALAARLREVEG